MSVPRIVKKLSLSVGTLLLCLGIPTAWVWYTFAGPGYYAEFNDIKAALNAIPDVQLLHAWGNTDITFQDIGAEIQVKNKGTITFCALARDSFRSTPVICLLAIGPYQFEYRSTGYFGVVNAATGEPVPCEVSGSAIDIGSDGDFAQLFPFPIKTIQDVIARYDDICSILETWPVAPERGHFRDKRGTDYYYSVKKPVQSRRPTDP